MRSPLQRSLWQWKRPAESCIFRPNYSFISWGEKNIIFCQNCVLDLIFNRVNLVTQYFVSVSIETTFQCLDVYRILIGCLLTNKFISSNFPVNGTILDYSFLLPITRSVTDKSMQIKII